MQKHFLSFSPASIGCALKLRFSPVFIDTFVTPCVVVLAQFITVLVPIIITAGNEKTKLNAMANSNGRKRKDRNNIKNETNAMELKELIVINSKVDWFGSGVAGCCCDHISLRFAISDKWCICTAQHTLRQPKVSV